MAITYYEGERINFRPLELEDEALCRRWVNDPANWKTLGRMLPVNAVREREFIQSQYASPTDLSLGIVTRDTGTLIGLAGLGGISGVNRTAEFGLLIGERTSQSKGYGTEATRLMLRYGFSELNLNRIELRVLETNSRGIRAYERAGFVREGCDREAVFRGGRYVDMYRYSILRDEWQHRRNGEFTQEEDGLLQNDDDDASDVSLAAMCV